MTPKKQSITEQAEGWAQYAAAGAEAANEAARAAQAAADERSGQQYIRGVKAWDWAEYAEQSARRAQEYARAASAAAQGHDIPEANRRLANTRSEAYGAWSNAERAGYVRPR